MLREDRNKQLIFWLSFAAIFFLGIIAGYLFFENHFPILSNRKLRYAAIFLMLALITAIGYYAWHKCGAPWTKKIWILFYAGSITILVIAGVIDLFIYDFAYGIKKDLHHFRTLLLTPLPFLSIYLLQRIYKRR